MFWVWGVEAWGTERRGLGGREERLKTMWLALGTSEHAQQTPISKM